MLNPSSSGNSLQACVYIFTVLSTVLLVLRFHSARLVRRRLYADDAFVAFGWVSAIRFRNLSTVSLPYLPVSGLQLLDVFTSTCYASDPNADHEMAFRLAHSRRVSVIYGPCTTEWATMWLTLTSSSSVCGSKSVFPSWSMLPEEDHLFA